MFRAGQLQVTATVPSEKENFWQKDKTGVFQSDPLLSTAYLILNISRAPLTDPRVRRALSFAVDREGLVKYVTRGGELPAYAFTPPGTGGYRSKKLIPTDLSRLEEAKKLLSEAGFADPRKFPRMDILYNTNALNKKVCEAIQQMWKKNLGIEIGIYNQEWKVFLNSIGVSIRDYAIARDRWAGDYDDPNTFLELLGSKSGQTNPGFHDKTYDALIEASNRELDPVKRRTYFDKMEKILADEVPLIPLYFEKKNYLLAPNVQNWGHNSLGLHSLEMVRMK